MSPALAHLLTRLYPHYWRERYGDEFEGLLQAEEGGMGSVGNVVWAAFRERFHPTPGLRKDPGASYAHVRSLGKAPWLAFGIAPLFFLFLSYFAACSILWSGWRILLPESPTPFVTIDGAAVFYFGFGRLLYFGSPFFVGWTIAFRAARHRPRAVWPVLGLLAVALVGSAAHVNVIRPSVGTTGRVSMDLSRLPFSQGSWKELLQAVLIFTLTGLPLLIWRSRLLIAPWGGRGVRGPLG